MKNFSKALSLILFLGLYSQAYAQSGICNSSGKGGDLLQDQSKLCAPYDATWDIWYYGLNINRTNEVVIDWGDGSAPEVATLVCTNPSASLSFRKFQITATHRYPKGDGECNYVASVHLQVNGQECLDSYQTLTVLVWDTDDVLGNGLQTNVEAYEVCAGNSVTVDFTDVTEFSCLAPDHDYNVGRWIQWEYGTANTITGNVLIDGLSQTFPFKEAPVWLDRTETTSGVQTLDITVPNTSVTGEFFELTVHNWNSCNPYEDEFGNPTGNAPVSKTVYIRIIDAPKADFTINNNPACVNNAVQFGNTSTSGLQYLWDFGDGTTSTDINPFKKYAATGTYTVTLTVTNQLITGNTGTCITTISKDIEILPQPIADFSIDPAAAQCEKTDIALTNTSTNVPALTNWIWEIRKNSTGGQKVNVNGGNIGGIASTAKDITVNLPYFGSAPTATYYVRLTANTPNACSDNSGWKTVVVKANVETPVFVSPISSRCQEGGTTQYSATANHADSYEWEISPAAAGTIDNTGLVSWDSDFIGNASIKVTAKGCGADNSNNISVTVTPIVDDPTAITGDTEVCQGTTSGTYTTSAANATSYTWSITGAGNTISGTSASATVNWAPGFLGTATITVIAHGCGSTSNPYSMDIEVKPTPQLSNDASDYNLAICSGETAEFTPTATLSGSSFKWTTTVVGTVTGMSVTGDQPVGGKISDVLVNTGTAAGTVTYHIIPYKDGCEGDPKDFTVLVSPGKPDDAGAVSGTDEFCEKETGISFSVPTITNAVNYIWTLPTGATISSGNNTRNITVDFTNTAAGNHVISVYGWNNCGTGADATYNIEINPIPVLSTTVVDNEICHEEEAVVGLSSDIPGTVYSWAVHSKGSNISGNSDATNQSVAEVRQQLSNNGTTPQNITYRITPIYDGCPGAYQDITFTVNPSPNVTISAAATALCDGGETDITLSSNVTGATYSWVATVADPSSLTGASDGNGDEIKQTLVNSSNTPQIVKYTVTPSANGCDGPSQEVTITVQPTPVLSTSVAVNTLCSEEDTDISLSSNVAGSNFSWTVASSDPGLTGAVSGSGNSIQQTLENITFTPQTVTYTITPRANACDGVSQDVTITVNPRPDLQINTAASQICDGEPTDIDFSSAVSGTDFAWTVTFDAAHVSGALAGTGDNITQTLVNTSDTDQTVTYHITTEADGCTGESKDVVITIHPTPILTLTPIKTELCSGENAGISFSSTVINTTYSWTVDFDNTKISGAFSGSGSSISQTLTNSGTAQEQVTYKVTPLANGCAGETKEVTITVNPPISDAVAGADDAICGLDYTMTATPPAVGTGKWTMESGPGTVSFDDDTDPNTQITVSDFGNYAFRWTLTNGSCGTDIDFVSLNFIDAPATSDISGVTEVCVNTQNGLYQVDYHTGSTYAWSFSPAADAPTIKFGGGINDYLISLDFGSNEWIGELTVTETNNGCAAPPKKITISSYQLPVAHAGDDQTICQGSPVTLGGSPSASGGSGNYTYLWSPAIGLNDPTLPNPTATLTFNRTYTLRVTDTSTGCVSAQDDVVITVEPQLQAGSIIGTQTICEGTVPAAFTENPASGGDGNYTYQWQKSTDGGATYVDISGANAALYEETSTLTSSTFYIRKVTGGVCGEQITTPIEVSVESALTAGSIGSNQTIVAGSTPAELTNITAATGGSGLQYQWQKATGTGTFTNIPGATGAAYQPAALSVTTFFRRVALSSGACAAVESNIVTVSVEAASEAGTIEENQVICINTIPAPITEKDLASGGTGTYSYRWLFSEDGVSFAIITGENGIDYTPTAPLIVTTYYKREMQSGVAPWLSSNVITVTVEDELNPGIIAGNQIICQGGNPAAFTETTAPQGGSGTYQYQWKESNSASGPFTAISGAIYAIYDVPAGLSATTYFVREVSGSVCQPRLSNVLEVIVEPTLTGGSIGGAQIVCLYGNPDAFTNGTNPEGGDGSFTYQWQSKIGSAPFVDIDDADAITYDVPAGIEFTTTYRRKVSSGSCASAYSNEIVVTVLPTLNPGSITGAQTICENGTPSQLTSIAPASGSAGFGSYQYQWKSSQDASGPFVVIPDANGASYTPSALSDTTYFVREVTSGACGPELSNVIRIAVQPTLLAGEIEGDTTICRGELPGTMGSVSPAAGGNGSPQYQWMWSYTQGGPYAEVVGATSESYTPATAPNITIYYVRRANAGTACGAQYSNEVKVTADPPVNPGSLGGTQIICEGETPSAFGQNPASGGTEVFEYQWQVRYEGESDFADITGAIAATYFVADPMDKSAEFRRRVRSGVCEEKYTNTIQVTVHPTVTPGSVGISQTIPANTAPLLFEQITAPGGGTNSYQYQWKQASDINGPYSIIYGANDSIYQAGNLSSNTYFIREVNSGECPAVPSIPILITIEPNAAAGIIGNNQIICEGSVPQPLEELSPASGGNDTYLYQWQVSTHPTTGFTDIDGEEDKEYMPTEMLYETTYYRRGVQSGVNPWVYTTAVRVVVQPTLTAGEITGKQTICENGIPAMFGEDVAATGGAGPGSYTYQWKSSTDPAPDREYTDIPLATNRLYKEQANLTQTTYYIRETSSGNDECEPVLSNFIVITVNPALQVGTISGEQTICENGTLNDFTQTDASGGNDTLQYQWQRKVNNDAFMDIPGYEAKEALYLETEELPVVNGQITRYAYRRRVTAGICPAAYTEPFVVTVEPSLNPGNLFGNQAICEGSKPEFDSFTQNPAVGGDGIYEYQWQKATGGGEFADIPGAVFANFTENQNLYDTTYYRRKVIAGVCGEQISDTIRVVVHPALDPGSIAPLSQSIAWGTIPDTFTEVDTVSGGDSNDRQYQWEYATTRNGVYTVITGTNVKEYGVTTALTSTLYYRRGVKSGACDEFVYTEPVEVIVENPLAPGSVASEQLICEEDVPDDLVEASSAEGGAGPGTYEYQWKSASDPNGPYENVATELVEDARARTLKFVQGLTVTTYFKRAVRSGAYDWVITEDYAVIRVQPTLLPGSVENIGASEVCFSDQIGRFEQVGAPSGGDGDYGYQWMSSTQPGGPYQEIEDAIYPDYQVSNDLAVTTYFVRRVSSGQCDDVLSNELEVVVHPLPVVSLTSSIPNDIICSGTEVSFTAAGAEMYEFYVNGVSVQGPSANNMYVTDSLVHMDEVYVLGTDGNSCQSLSNSIITIVNDLPTVSIDGSANICKGSQTSLILHMTGKMPFEVVYTDGSQNYTLKNLAYESILNVQPSASTTYSLVSVKDANGCAQDIADQEAVVNVGDAVAQFSIIGDNPACSPQTLTFVNENIQQGVTYTWVWGDGTEDDVTTVADAAEIEHTFINYTSSRDMTYQVTLIATHDAIGCTDRSVSSVHVYPSPEVRVERDVEEGCGPLLVHFVNNSFGAENHRWYYRVKGTAEVLEETSSKNVSYILPNTTSETLVYEVVYEASTSKCMAEPAIFEVVVHPELKPYFTVSPAQQNLPNSTVSITNRTNEGDWDYHWDFGDGTSSTEKDPDSHTYESYGQFYITLTVTNGSCEKEYEERVVIDIDPDLPFVEFSADTHVGCGPLTVTFTNESNYIDPSTFQWDFGDGTGASGIQHPVHTYTRPGKYSVKLEAVNIFGEFKVIMKDFLVEVYDQPRAIFSAGPPTVYLPDRPLGTINQSIGATAYEWHFGDGTVSNEFEPTHIYTEEGMYDITLIVFNEQGCSDTLLIERVVSVLQPEAGKTRIPNSFTPNPNVSNGGHYQHGDVSNDIFIPVIDGVSEMSMTIYNRWGKVMFTSKNKNTGWDGYYENQVCPADVYYYKIEMKFSNGERRTEYGDVTLIR
ncbi:PKD-like domain-containing protein [Catalinimonas niigatensis]|uniref:PKD-like domain-containing protein n=1 Tax=Catalinimonas niigatensis TaxID=1397264 RepID=UPI002665C0D8|nr:PKD-like domain-containing protein [Catalinimonas niigatensis]WPP49324.1 PKD-like domain-containing protein [Catalinimonas niigatensis]